ncbi:HIT family protein [Dictyobacter aurantiacus]|uniref:HIT domain-containing protein n=1 Tax=Dictyobacter aurantiacus TaxID=1936993 RepID=A0A401Z7Z2_9CHLR|nr:HIT domain-containing protein [Dictyobacter aurantiacus]GCE02938.1 hypothetical protein KDAU_02670 [Dictyobacter aurantiacus]
MQRQSSASSDTHSTSMLDIKRDCTFCQIDRIAPLIMKETPNLRLVADHAPLVEGHILIIPKQHYTCYGDVPSSLDDELFGLKQEVRRFFELYYTEPVYWEHGIFHQTVFHAHLHCFPIGPLTYDLEHHGHGQRIHSQEDIRSWHQQNGHYFYLEDTHHGYLFPPEPETYSSIIRNVLGPAVAAHSSYKQWRLPQERQIDGKPLIASAMAHWKEFEHTGQAGTRSS